jgi:hypothetical protein
LLLKSFELLPGNQGRLDLILGQVIARFPPDASPLNIQVGLGHLLGRILRKLLIVAQDGEFIDIEEIRLLSVFIDVVVIVVICASIGRYQKIEFIPIKSSVARV